MNKFEGTIKWEDFLKVHLRKGTIVRAETFPEARKPAYKVWVDFGPELGVKKTSAQITDNYTVEELVGRPVIGITNFPPKQIGPFMSEFLLTGFDDGKNGILLAKCDNKIPDGALLQ